MSRILAALLVAGTLAVIIAQEMLEGTATSDAPRAGYLVLAISWTPSWCAGEADRQDAARCAPGAGAGWLVHGLWPQFEGGGWPEFCDTPHDAPSRAQTAAMRDIMGSDGLAFHQWRKHGTCTGLNAQDYFDQTRAAFASVILPERTGPDERRLRVTPDDMLAMVRDANPALGADMAILTCRDNTAQEIRLCLSHDLTPRRCDTDLLARSCRARSVDWPALP